MKIAIPTMDEVSISAHFGHSKGFLIVEVVEGQVCHQEFRANQQAAPQTALQDHAHVAGVHHHHDHSAFARTLGDCQVVLSRGMGQGARLALEGAGLKVVMLREDLPALDAARLYAAGTLVGHAGSCCPEHS
jgi:predicted Fe-Mo cluster-binding NifX family protein